MDQSNHLSRGRVPPQVESASNQVKVRLVKVTEAWSKHRHSKRTAVGRNPSLQIMAMAKSFHPKDDLSRRRQSTLERAMTQSQLISRTVRRTSHSNCRRSLWIITRSRASQTKWLRGSQEPSWAWRSRFQESKITASFRVIQRVKDMTSRVLRFPRVFPMVSIVSTHQSTQTWWPKNNIKI